MTPEDLHQRAARGEDLHTEFKEARVHAEALAAALVSFANTDGGELLLGVTDDGTVAGVPDPDAAVRLVEDAARQRCKPAVTVSQEVVRVGEAAVVVVHVPRGAERPYRTNQGVHYVRTAGGKQQASRQELLRLFQGARSLFYDESPVPEATLGEMDRGRVEAYLAALAAAGWDEALLANLNLARPPHPTVAGLLLFGRAPQQRLPGAYVSAARVAGTSLADEVRAQERIEGSLPDVIDGCWRFLRGHLIRTHDAEGFEPEGRPELPEAALREAVTNAVAHRDYSIAGPVRILVYDDRVEVRSPGRLPNTVTVEAMRRGAAHVQRNPTLFAVLLRQGRVTDVGRGVERICRLARERTGREVELREDAAEFVVAIPRPAPDG